MLKFFFLRLKILLFLATFALGLGSFSNGRASVATVAILPFQINADEDIAYINRGIRQMLTSRVTYGSQIMVIEQSLVNNVFSKVASGKLTKKNMLEIGNTLGADFVVFGSITKFGNNVSLDLNVLNVLQGGITAPIFIQCSGLDELMPKVNDLAQEIKDTLATGPKRQLAETVDRKTLGSVKTMLSDKSKVDTVVLEEIKAELKQEILAELRQEGGMQAPTVQSPVATDPKQLKAELTEEILVKLRKQNKVYGYFQAPKDTGSAEGRMLRNSKGLNGCRVKLVKMMKGGLLSEMFQGFQEGTEFETVTDKEGIYRLEGLPVGAYKIKWELPGDKGWIRRLRDKPDVIIENGKQSIVKDVETNRRLVPR